MVPISLRVVIVSRSGPRHPISPLGLAYHNLPDDGAYLASGFPLVLPRRYRLQDRLLSRLHHPAQGTRRIAHLHVKPQTREKLTYRFNSHAALKAKGIERGDHPAG